jgi:hypothetical protein
MDSITYSFEDLVSAESGDIYDNPDKTSFNFEFINDSGKPVVSKDEEAMPYIKIRLFTNHHVQS